MASMNRLDIHELIVQYPPALFSGMLSAVSPCSPLYEPIFITLGRLIGAF